MWFYDNITREEFEKKKDYIEKVMLELGAIIFDIKLPYKQKTTTYSSRNEDTCYSKRNIYVYNDQYFRVDEVLFDDKPFIVLECGTLQDLMNNTMEDLDPFPYDLEYNEIRNEIKYSFGIESYPN